MCEFLDKGGSKKNTANPSAVILYRECTGSTTHGGETIWLGYPCQLDPVHSLYGMTANNSHTWVDCELFMKIGMAWFTEQG